MEVAMPPTAMDFDFNDANPMPFMSAPSTPKRFGDITLSAPTSPSRIAEFYSRFDDFAWDDNATPASPMPVPNHSGDDFAFDFRSELEESSLSADELFDGGKIRPLKPPPRLQIEERRRFLSPRSARSPIAQGKKIIREVFSPRKKKDSDPFTVADENTRKRAENGRGRGRERHQALATSSSRRSTRSLSPHRVSEYPWEEEERKLLETTKQSAAPNSKPSGSSTSSSAATAASTTKSSSKKWRLMRDFLLFRSASEGRAADKDPLRTKFPFFFRKPEDAKNTSSRSKESTGSVPASRRKGQVSAHELHYTKNKAASEDMKKKTFLPYKQGILGRKAFNPKAR